MEAGHCNRSNRRDLTQRYGATGLCILAFQGAGYTHRQHQYARTVDRALTWMVAHQGSDGDLYKREDETSNRNVWLYSHGVAALALCEAYG